MREPERANAMNIRTVENQWVRRKKEAAADKAHSPTNTERPNGMYAAAPMPVAKQTASHNIGEAVNSEER
ncbi:MAG: hypothetical protein AAB288_05240 [Acidobacteriota bacterium]